MIRKKKTKEQPICMNDKGNLRTTQIGDNPRTIDFMLCYLI